LPAASYITEESLQKTAGEKVSTNPQTKAAGKPQVKNPLANHR
jgi:hypothetical protein